MKVFDSFSFRYSIFSSQRSTLYGTDFSRESMEQLNKRMSKKLFGIGVGPAFIGGAGFGYGAGLLTYSIYHRYIFIRSLMYNKDYISKEEYDPFYYDTYYKRYESI